jgi:hypothetical protein
MSNWASLIKTGKPIESYKCLIERKAQVKAKEIAQIKAKKDAEILERKTKENAEILERKMKSDEDQKINDVILKDKFTTPLPIGKKADKNILAHVAEAAKILFIREQKTAKYHATYPVSVQYHHQYIADAKVLKIAITNDMGWGHCDLHSIISLPYEGEIYYAYWTYSSGSCSHCDSDRAMGDEAQEMERKECTEYIATELARKIKYGSIYTTLDALVSDLRESRYWNFDELFRQMTGVPEKEKFRFKTEKDFSEDVKLALEKYPVPCDTVAHLITEEKSATLRDMFNAIGMGEMTSDRGKEIGIYLKKRISTRSRETVQSTRGDYMVILYEPDELALIEALIRRFTETT